jgi:hypothetical protein
MDPQKHKQMVNQLFENSAKSQEELDKMTPEERKEYLRGRLKQKLFFNGASRQSMQQKKKMQENIQDKMDESTTGGNGDEPVSKKKEKNKKKRDKKKAAKMTAMAEDITTGKAVRTTEASNETSDEDIVIVKRDSESDYESDEN